MKIILIYNNEELFKALNQARKFLPECEIRHVENIISGMFEDVHIFIADIAIINNIKKELVNKELRTIAVGSNPIHQDGVIFIKKPYLLKEMVEAIRNAIIFIISNNNINIGDFEFDTGSRTLIKGDEEIMLTEKEADLIMLLYKANKNIISREEILKKVWGYEVGIDTHTIETHIYRIRQKIGKDNNFIGSSAAGYFIE